MARSLSNEERSDNPLRDHPWRSDCLYDMWEGTWSGIRFQDQKVGETRDHGGGGPQLGSHWAEMSVWAGDPRGPCKTWPRKKIGRKRAGSEQNNPGTRSAGAADAGRQAQAGCFPRGNEFKVGDHGPEVSFCCPIASPGFSPGLL